VLKFTGMFTGAHVLLYSKDADADRVFLRDILGFRAVDAGHGWLILALPPAEAAVHPVDERGESPGGEGILGAHLYLMCADVEATVKSLQAKHVRCGPLSRERWGIRTTIPLPSGGQIGLYQPLHPTAI
jgi:catechol 2,3-dioxygenase-like lactoylglutathione lyase family enzyme